MARWNHHLKTSGMKYLNEIVTPVNERRHGDTMYLPITILVRDLRERMDRMQ